MQGYCIKNLNNLHNSIALQLHRCLQENNLPKWVVTGKSLLFIKVIQKRNLVSNFRPITCLPIIWKLLTGILAEELYEHLEKTNSLPCGQKEYRKGSRGTKDQLLIGETVVKDCKRRLTSLAVAWIEYFKAYDMVPHNWIQKCMEVFGVAVNVRSFVNASMKLCNTELTAGNQRLGNLKTRRGMFQGDSLSPLLFVLVMIQLTLVLRQTKASYEVKKGGKKINHLLFIDDLRLFTKNDDQIDSLVNQ